MQIRNSKPSLLSRMSRIENAKATKQTAKAEIKIAREKKKELATLHLDTDETCPDCSNKMQDIASKELTMRVCLSCRVALPGVVKKGTI